VTKLNETAASLESRVQQTEERSQRLQTLVEENQVKLDRIQTDLANLTNTLYRHLGLSAPSGQSNSSLFAPSEEVQIERPSATRDLESPSARVTTPPDEPSQTVIQPEQPATPSGSNPQTTGNPMEAYERAQNLFLNRQYQEALAAYTNYLSRYPDSTYADNAQFWKAQTLLKLERDRDAIAEYQKLIDNYPESDKVPPSYYYQGLAYGRLGQRDEAVETLQYVVDQYPASAAATQAQQALQEAQQ